MKKTAYLVGAWPVWSETFIQQDLRLMLEEGAPVFPVAISPGDGAPPPGLPPVPTLVPEPPRSRAVARVTRTLLPRSVRRGLGALRYAPALDALVRLCEVERIAHIHAAFGGTPAALASAAARRLGIPYSASAHAADVYAGVHDDVHVYENARAVLTCNECVHRELHRRSPWLADRLHLVHHGLCLDEWPFRETARLADPLRFLFVGRLIGKKDPLAAVRLVREVVRRGIPAQLTMIGDGELLPRTKAAARGCQANFPGVLPRSEVAAAMRHSDFLLATSREERSGDREGIPNAILEAMATGTPVLAARGGGVGEVVTEATGWPIDPGSPAAFAALVQRLRADPSAIHPRVEAARAEIEHRFDASTLIRRRLGLLVSVPGITISPS